MNKIKLLLGRVLTVRVGSEKGVTTIEYAVLAAAVVGAVVIFGTGLGTAITDALEKVTDAIAAS